METKSDDKHRKTFVKCIDTLGFNIFTIWRFFYFIRDQVKEIETLIEAIPGGANMWCNGLDRTKHLLGIERSPWDICYERREIRSVAVYAAALLVPAERLIEGEPLAVDLSLIMKQTQINSVLSDENNRKTRTKLFKSFFAYFFSPEIIGEEKALLKFRMVLKYWRGILDTHRVVLTLAGKNAYPEDIKEADIFLKLMESELIREPKRRTLKTK